jgi:hypothetical protein
LWTAIARPKKISKSLSKNVKKKHKGNLEFLGNGKYLRRSYNIKKKLSKERKEERDGLFYVQRIGTNGRAHRLMKERGVNYSFS